MLTGCTALLKANGGVEFRVHRPDNDAGRPSLVSVAHDRGSQVAALFIGNLLYRENLGGCPGASGTSDEDLSDAELTVAAYVRGGRAALERLEGEFALILWDGARRRLLALRDPCGSWPLFWLEQGGTTAIGTSLEALVRLQPGRSFDQDFLADFLMWPNPHAELPCERTAFVGARRILAGTIVEFNPDGQVQQERYWDWGSRIQPSPGITREEAAETVALLLRQAVRQRMQHGPVAAHLSGGMDSSAVACVARDLLASTGGRLETLSLVYQRPSLAGERTYIDEVLKQGGPVSPHFLPGETAADYDWFRTGVPFHEEPYGGLPGAGMAQLLLDAADRTGAGTVLSGWGSDEIFAVAPVHIADLMQQGRWWAAIRQARAWARAGTPAPGERFAALASNWHGRGCGERKDAGLAWDGFLSRPGSKRTLPANGAWRIGPGSTPAGWAATPSARRWSATCSIPAQATGRAGIWLRRGACVCPILSRTRDSFVSGWGCRGNSAWRPGNESRCSRRPCAVSCPKPSASAATSEDLTTFTVLD